MNEAGRIAAAKQGDNRALAELLQENYRFVFKYLLQVTLHQSSAEDLTQDTMIRAIEKIHLYDERKSKFSSWLITIATRLYLDNRRRHRRETELLSSKVRFEDETRQMRWHVNQAGGDWSALVDALSHLPMDARAAVILKHYYGYGYEEIADILSIPAGTAKSRVHHGLRALRKEWESDETDTPSHK